MLVDLGTQSFLEASRVMSAATSDLYGAQWNTIENVLVVWLISMLVLALIHFGQKGPFDDF